MKWHLNTSYIPLLFIFGLAIFQFWKGKGFIYKVMINMAKKENPDLNESDFRKQWLRAFVVISGTSLALQIAIACLR